MKRIFAILLSAALLLVALPVSTPAQAALRESVYSEIEKAYGGADGIVSLTFDDGYYKTALVLDELFEKHDLVGSLMLVPGFMYDGGAYASADTWREIFSEGRLEPQNHSMSHANLSDAGDPENQTDEVFKYEMLDSAALLKECFPEYDFITYAMPYGKMSDEAMEYIKGHYFAVRATTAGVQSLDPDFSDGEGSWSRLHSPPVIYDYMNEDEQQWEWIKRCIDNATEGWYAPIIHRVGDEEGADLSYDMADRMFEYIAALRDEGRVWVTTFSEATKYVRERQNSTATAYSENGNIFVEVAMAEHTADFMYLDGEIFDTPLSVKVEVPAFYGTVYYTLAGREYTAESFSDGSGNYVCVDVIPNSAPVELRLASTHTFGDWGKHDGDNHKRLCIDCGLEDYSEHIWDEGVITQAPTHMREGERLCTCTVCGEAGTRVAEKTDEHLFNKRVSSLAFRAEKASCTHGTLYYYSCLCGAIGEETFEVGEALGHSFGKWSVEKKAAPGEDGLRARSCECGEREEEIIPALADESTEKGDTGGVDTPVLIGIIAGGILLAVVGAIACALVIKKRKKPSN